MAGFTAVAYATYSVLLHSLHYGSFAYDLGIFDQTFWHWSNLETPRNTITGLPNELGDHFFPILLLLVPLYWLWSDPQVLLIAQGALLGAALVPVFLFARSRVGRLPAYLLTAAYGLFWAVHTAVAFNFHEVAFAPLLIGLTVLAVDRRDWRSYFVLVVALLLVKENMALLVAALGGYLLFFRAYRQAAITFALGVVWFFVTTQFLIPHFTGGWGFRHWSYIQFGNDLPEAVGTLVSEPWRIFSVLVEPSVKVKTMLLLFAPFLFLTLFSPLAVLCIPLLAERMLSVNPNFWTPDMHYSLVIAPIVVLGAADGLRRVIALLGAERRSRVVVTAAAAAILIANAAIATQFRLSSLADPSFYVKSDEDRVVDRALSLIPPNVSVTAWTHYVPHLSQRRNIYELRGPRTRQGQYLIANTVDYYEARFPKAGYVDRYFLVRQYSRRYEPIFWQGDVVVMRRRSRAEIRAASSRGGGRDAAAGRGRS
ncbi:MAG: DUF2079 domain-containing protein [Actinomycetota bacterium]|nr:DUF2079 domain-containing protein [Actinomycetota bacterium]